MTEEHPRGKEKKHSHTIYAVVCSLLIVISVINGLEILKIESALVRQAELNTKIVEVLELMVGTIKDVAETDEAVTDGDNQTGVNETSTAFTVELIGSVYDCSNLSLDECFEKGYRSEDLVGEER